MLSYRHAFHAGNHADVLKHVVLLAILHRLVQKDKPLRYVETHAGAGGYDLHGREAERHREHAGGIGRIFTARDAPPAVSRLLELARRYNGDGPLRRYPGSPWLARAALRPDDDLYLCELHKAEHAALARGCRGDRRVTVLHADGFEGAVGLVPPPSRRALVFVDPSYETKDEEARVIDLLAKLARRFATGVYAVWYPLLERRRPDAFERKLRAAGLPPLDVYALRVAPEARGMTGSAMLVANAPWKVADEMREALPWLAHALGGDRASHRVATAFPPLSSPPAERRHRT
ncbi:MAG TPA: 23S rRNA (adenine(2030)-N(6))-methyltransferase RlmJ [Gammaproteobacteria bacterium]